MQFARGLYNGFVEVIVLAIMRGGVADVDPFLISQNTLGNGKTTTQNLKDKCQMVVAESGGGLHLAMREWSDGIYTVSELKQWSLSSRNTLGDANHNSNNLKCKGEQNWLGCGSRWWLCEVMVEALGKDAKVPKI